MQPPSRLAQRSMPEPVPPAGPPVRAHAATRVVPFLVYQDSQGEQQVMPLPDDVARLTLGRGDANDLQLDWDLEVSRVHAELERVGDDWVLADDGLSRNGTFVNGERLGGRRRLRDGDSIHLGSVRIVYRAPRTRAEQPTAAAQALPAVHLSEAQRRVLVALCRPYAHGGPYSTPATNQMIAEELVLSVDAVKTHLRALFARFAVEDLPQNAKRARLVELAFQAGIVARQDLA